MMYNWQHKDWPNFTYKTDKQGGQLVKYSVNTGLLLGMADSLGNQSKNEVIINMLVAEAMKTSEIEGEYFSRDEVYSSIQKNLGLKPFKNVKNAKAEGIAELVVHVHENFEVPLSKKELFSWHSILMHGYRNTSVGKWRFNSEPMQVVSGTIGREKVHFEAPPSAIVAPEMKTFIQWFNDSAVSRPGEISNPIIRAAIAHVYFESIHPFEDGNGRIGRAISEKALSQGINQPILFSLSKSIEKAKGRYYTALKQAQRTLDLTQWIEYFTSLILDAQEQAKEEIQFVIRKTKFYDTHGQLFNDRQSKVLKRMLEAGPQGFEGGMTAKKYMSITKSSKATATRDLQQLQENNILIRSGGGRSVSYQINI